MFYFRSAIVAVVLLSPALMQAAEHRARRVDSPGFWERAWNSSRKASSTIGGRIAHPFTPSEKKAKSADKAWNQLEMAMVLDPAVVKLPTTRSIQVKVSLVNRAKKLVQLEFPTSRRIDVVLHGELGAVISRYSDDEKVEEESSLVSLNPNERLEYTANISTRDMKPGVSYRLEAFFPAYESLRASANILGEK